MKRKFLSLCGAVLILCLLIGTSQLGGTVATLESGRGSPMPIGQPEPRSGRALDLLTLIDNDYQDGVIDKETAIRYEAYAMFDRAKLDEVKSSNAKLSLNNATDERSDPTMALLEMKRDFYSFSDGVRAELQSYGIQPIGELPPADAAADYGATSSNCEGFLSTGSGAVSFPSSIVKTNFIVHYTTSGTHAATSSYATWIANNLEEGWSRNRQLKWKNPSADGWLGGSTDKIDFYIADLTGVWGVAIPMYWDTSTGNPNDAMGYACVENSLPTTPYNLQQTTPVHEFHHLVQFAHNIFGSGWYFESFSVWFEEKVFPANNHWVSRAQTFLWWPELMLTSTYDVREYGAAIWWLYVDDMLSEDVTRRVYARRALDPFGVEHGWADVKDALSEYSALGGWPTSRVMYYDFSIANWFTGYWGQDAFPRGLSYVQHDANLLGETYVTAGCYSGSVSGVASTDGYLEGYGAEYVCFTAVTNPSLTFAFDGENGATMMLTTVAMVGDKDAVVYTYALDANNDRTFNFNGPSTYTNIIVIIRNMSSPESGTEIGWTLSWA